MNEGALYIENNECWKCFDCGNTVPKGEEWDKINICPKCLKEIWLEVNDNNLSYLF